HHGSTASRHTARVRQDFTARTDRTGELDVRSVLASDGILPSSRQPCLATDVPGPTQRGGYTHGHRGTVAAASGACPGAWRHAHGPVPGGDRSRTDPPSDLPALETPDCNGVRTHCCVLRPDPRPFPNTWSGLAPGHRAHGPRPVPRS